MTVPRAGRGQVPAAGPRRPRADEPRRVTGTTQPNPFGATERRPAPVRPAAAVNAEIRALVLACGGWLYGESRERYEQLVAEWTVAVQAERACGEIVKAAQVTGHEDKLFELQQRLAGRLIDGLGLALSPEEQQRVLFVSTVLDSAQAMWATTLPRATGTQYRSLILVEDESQRAAAEASRDAYQAVLARAGYGRITTEIGLEFVQKGTDIVDLGACLDVGRSRREVSVGLWLELQSLLRPFEQNLNALRLWRPNAKANARFVGPGAEGGPPLARPVAFVRSSTAR